MSTTLPRPARDKPSTGQLTGLGITIGSQSLPTGMAAGFPMLNSQTLINPPRMGTPDNRLGVNFAVSDVTCKIIAISTFSSLIHFPFSSYPTSCICPQCTRRFVVTCRASTLFFFFLRSVFYCMVFVVWCCWLSLLLCISFTKL